MVDETLKRYHEERFREFLAACRTPLFERVLELDMRGLEPEVWRAKEEYLKTLTPAQLEEPRAVLLADLDDATRASAVEAELGLKAVAGFLVKRPGESDEAFTTRYEQIRQKLR